MKIAFCVAARRWEEEELQRSLIAALPIYTLCQAKAFPTRLWLRQVQNILHGIKNMAEYIIMKGNCTFSSLNMGLKRNADAESSRGSSCWLVTPAWIRPPAVPHWSSARVWLTFRSAGMVKKGRHSCCLIVLKPSNRNSHLAKQHLFAQVLQ